MGELGVKEGCRERKRHLCFWLPSVFIASRINLNKTVTVARVICDDWIVSDIKTQVPAQLCLSN